ncbi:2-C-methyl-D-erythritol 4-phosphate cytidylyltransferase [Caulifigura coniformis]|uniref:2-C-methyl-D-erythritol 4-phosphate cytidylyltransferase n=1 Tax=Caulifigura coniformis TaxID=2527983 RepID=A0A517S7N9_9PLAN|nr:2-C-methyl-D-erythritol 4-phosphate cytidylyltransferase [Caulifigura coniformis]QDT52140.1 2-C-methyl-D-erythritol 4-phosphate cytidylyltransferase [Caulifigura coniformis]
MPSFAVILPAAGSSSRFGDPRRKKPFIDLKGRPVWVRSLELFLSRDDVKQALIVLPPDEIEWFKEKFRANLAFMNVEIVAGGKERADSVQNALARVRSDIDFVAVHDAARPMIVKKWIEDVFAAAIRDGAAIPALPISSTVKKVDRDRKIVETIPRDGLWAAQTPQVARRDWLLDAFGKRGTLAATDEAQLLENAGRGVTIVECSPLNLKITTQEDFKMAEALVDMLPREKTLGQLHPFADERFIV